MSNAISYAKRIVYGYPSSIYFTLDMARRYKDSPGCYVECGVAAGAHIIAMLHGAMNKHVFAFDSFEGIMLPSNRDNQMPGIRMLKDWEQKALPDPGKQELKSSGATVVSIDDFWNNIQSAIGLTTNLITVKGWFEETMLNLPFLLGDISILRLDGDLYNSTWVCLQHLFPKCLKGACVIVDDWALPGCRDACKEYFELIDYSPDWQFIESKESTLAYFYK